MEYRCAWEPQKLHKWSFCAGEPQKLRFWSFCAPGASENFVIYKAWWSIAAHGNLQISTTGVSAQWTLRYSVFIVSAHRVRQKISYPNRPKVDSILQSWTSSYGDSCTPCTKTGLDRGKKLEQIFSWIFTIMVIFVNGFCMCWILILYGCHFVSRLDRISEFFCNDISWNTSKFETESSNKQFSIYHIINIHILWLLLDLFTINLKRKQLTYNGRVCSHLMSNA